ncbi:MAG TPA: PAS domain-containing protein, partial [Polyangiaceae bacterium]|nr:PAS domain-containing protein [Polyangiaceae bacterium]
MPRHDSKRPVTDDSPGLFRALFQHMAEGVALHEVIYDDAHHAEDYRILDVNPAYSLLTGLTREVACGKCSREVYGGDSPPYLQEFMVAGHDGRPHRFETYFLGSSCGWNRARLQQPANRDPRQ